MLQLPKQMFRIPMVEKRIPQQFIDNFSHFILHLFQFGGCRSRTCCGGGFRCQHKCWWTFLNSKTIRHNFKSNFLFVYFLRFIHCCSCWHCVLIYFSLTFFEAFPICYAKQLLLVFVFNCIAAFSNEKYCRDVQIYFEFASNVNNSKIFQLKLFGNHSGCAALCYVCMCV